MSFVVALSSEKLEALLAGHVEAFEFFGGTFREVWYENAKTAVTKILVDPHSIEHERLRVLRAHYLIDALLQPGVWQREGLGREPG